PDDDREPRGRGWNRPDRDRADDGPGVRQNPRIDDGPGPRPLDGDRSERNFAGRAPAERQRRLLEQREPRLGDRDELRPAVDRRQVRAPALAGDRPDREYEHLGPGAVGARGDHAADLDERDLVDGLA